MCFLADACLMMPTIFSVHFIHLCDASVKIAVLYSDRVVTYELFCGEFHGTNTFPTPIIYKKISRFTIGSHIAANSLGVSPLHVTVVIIVYFKFCLFYLTSLALVSLINDLKESER